MNEKKSHNFLKAGIPLSLIFIGAVSGIMILSSVQDVAVEHQILVNRQPTLVTGDGNPGAGVTGFFYFMVYPHSATPLTTYAANLSNATAYEFSDTGDAVCTGETPAGSTFDLVVKVGINDDDGYNVTEWEDGWTWCLLTCADLSIGANSNMTEKQIANTSTYAWYQYYLNNGGAGYTVGEGVSFNVTSVKYYVQRIV